MTLNRKYKKDRKEYARQIVKEGKTPKQVLKANKPYLNDHCLSTVTARWNTDIKVCKAIADQVRALGMNRDDILHLIKGRMFRIVSNLACKDSDSISASNMLAKLDGLISADSFNSYTAIVNKFPDLAEFQEIKRKLLSDKELSK